MVDFGATALKGLKDQGHDHREIDVFCFTHLHGDHIGGIPFWLLDSSYCLVRDRPIEIVGPVGVETRLRELLRVTYGDVADRDPPFEIRFSELKPGETIQVASWTIQGFAADHMEPPEQPLCIRIKSSDGGKVAFSGDTKICDGLFEAGKGVDLFVAECSAMQHPAGDHCTWEEWQENWHRLDTPHLMLTHLNQDMREQAPTLRGPDKLELTFADDGMVIEI